MRLRCTRLCLPLVAACSATPSLHDDLAARVAAFRGTAGVYVRHLGTGEEVAIAADETFPTASLVKVPILGALLARVEAGALDYHAKLTYDASRLYPGDDLLGSFADGRSLELAKVAMLMITTSDNTAALWCQELAGTGTAVNRWLEDQGFSATRVNSRTPGREAAKAEFGWGQTTPREMAEMLVRAREGTLQSAAASEEMMRCLARIYWDDEALSAIPPWVHTASKQGAVDRSRSEAVLVMAPHGDFVFCVVTKDQEDTSWRRDNEGFVLLRETAAACWRHFEPGLPYTMPAGSERFRY